MSNKPMYDAKLSEIASYAVLDKQGDKVILSFRLLGDEPNCNGLYTYHKRVVHSRYFSNYSVDVIIFNKKRYLINVECIDSVNYLFV